MVSFVVSPDHKMSGEGAGFLTSWCQIRSTILIHKLQITKVMDGEEGEEGKGEEGKGASRALEANHQEEMPVTPRIRIRSDLFSENRNTNVVQNMMLMRQLESPTGEDSEEEVEIVKVVEGNFCEETEMKGALRKIVFGELLPKAAIRLKPARKGLSERLFTSYVNLKGKLCCNVM